VRTPGAVIRLIRAISAWVASQFILAERSFSRRRPSPLSVTIDRSVLALPERGCPFDLHRQLRFLRGPPRLRARHPALRQEPAARLDCAIRALTNTRGQFDQLYDRPVGGAVGRIAGNTLSRRNKEITRPQYGRPGGVAIRPRAEKKKIRRNNTAALSPGVPGRACSSPTEPYPLVIRNNKLARG